MKVPIIVLKVFLSTNVHTNPGDSPITEQSSRALLTHKIAYYVIQLPVSEEGRLGTRSTTLTDTRCGQKHSHREEGAKHDSRLWLGKGSDSSDRLAYARTFISKTFTPIMNVDLGLSRLTGPDRWKGDRCTAAKLCKSVYFSQDGCNEALR